MKILSCLLCGEGKRRDTKTRYITQQFFYKKQSKVVAAIIETEDDDGDTEREREMMMIMRMRRAISVQKLFYSCRGPLLYEYPILYSQASPALK